MIADADTYVLSCGDAAIWNEVKVQRFLLPDRVHHHQSLNRKIQSQASLYPKEKYVQRKEK